MSMLQSVLPCDKCSRRLLLQCQILRILYVEMCLYTDTVGTKTKAVPLTMTRIKGRPTL